MGIYVYILTNVEIFQKLEKISFIHQFIQFFITDIISVP
jgi:hypothetical protein